MRDFHKLGNVTIADGAAVSDAIAVPEGYSVTMVGVPTSWSAADMGFQFAQAGDATFADLFTGVGTTVSRFRMTGIPTASASLVLVPGVLDIGLGLSVKVTSINTADNTDQNQTGAITLDIWIARVN